MNGFDKGGILISTDMGRNKEKKVAYVLESKHPVPIPPTVEEFFQYDVMPILWTLISYQIL